MENKKEEFEQASDERLLDLLSKQRCQIPCTMVDVVLDDVNKHVNGAEQSDDITIMSIIINNLKHK